MPERHGRGESLMLAPMSAAEATVRRRAERRARERSLTRAAILDAARAVAAREGAASLSVRAVAAEAGFAPAALYGYFANKNELLVALAADDLGVLARALREAGSRSGLAPAANAVLGLLENTETFAAVSSALPAQAGAGEAERIFNGRLIAALRALADAAGLPQETRADQADVVLVAAVLAGLAVFARTGRLGALGFSPQDIVAALDRHFTPAR